MSPDKYTQAADEVIKRLRTDFCLCQVMQGMGRLYVENLRGTIRTAIFVALDITEDSADTEKSIEEDNQSV